MPKVHDRGSWPTDEPIDQKDHVLMDWERQTHALYGILRKKGLIGTDELRRGIEALPPDQYQLLSYYERWSASLETLLVEKGILTTAEVDQKVKALAQRWE